MTLLSVMAAGFIPPEKTAEVSFQERLRGAMEGPKAVRILETECPWFSQSTPQPCSQLLHPSLMLYGCHPHPYTEAGTGFPQASVESLTSVKAGEKFSLEERELGWGGKILGELFSMF